MDKQQIRAQMKEFLAALTPADRHARSLAACRQLIATREFKHAQTIMIFMSMPSEVETSTLAVQAWQQCKNIAVPRVDWAGNRMDPIEITSLDTGMQKSGPEDSNIELLQPAQGMAVPLGSIDMIVVPGMAFDRQGMRVGRGRGFYDRFLAQDGFQGIRCTLCFHEQLIHESIVGEAHDAPMDLIVTDREVVRCHRPNKPD